jgi:hypothetical protein
MNHCFDDMMLILVDENSKNVVTASKTVKIKRYDLVHRLIALRGIRILSQIKGLKDPLPSNRGFKVPYRRDRGKVE